MSKPLYDTLGIDEDATEAEIDQAFKSQAKKAHPDAGGTPEEFERIKSAHLVLSNECRRSKYDDTGEIDEQQADNTDTKALDLIAEVLERVLDGDETVFQIDLPGRMRAQLQAGLETLLTQAKTLRTRKKKAEKLRKKFKRKSQGSNAMDLLMRWKVHRMEQPLAEIDQSIKTMRRAIEILSDYDFERDPLAPTVAAFTFTTSGTGSR